MSAFGEFYADDVNVFDLLGDTEQLVGEFVVDGAPIDSGSIELAVNVTGSISQESIPIPGVRVTGQIVRGVSLSNRWVPLPGLQSTGEIIPSATLTNVDFRLPVPDVSGVMVNSDSAVRLPGVSVSGTIAGSTIGRDGFTVLPGLRATGEIIPPTAQLQGAPRLPPVSVAGEVLNGASSLGSRIALAVDVAGSLIAGGVLGGAFALPALGLSGAGYEVASMSSGTIEIPVKVSGTIFGPAVGVATGDALVLNTRTLGLTRYQSFALNSFAVVGSRLLAAGADGIYEITGTTDGNTAIAARLTTGHLDFGAKSAVKLVGMFVSYRSAGELEVTLRIDDADDYVYRLPETRAFGVYRNRVKFGRGARGRYFQVSVANEAGADFSIDAMEYETQAIARRIV